MNIFLCAKLQFMCSGHSCNNHSHPTLQLRLRVQWSQKRHDTTVWTDSDKEVEIQNITVYVSGYTESDMTGTLSPPTDGEYLKLCKILIEFPIKFREYYKMNIKTFDYILDSVQDDLQGYSNFRKCTEAEEKLTVALRHVLIILVRINISYICTMVNAIKIQCNLSL